MSWNYDMDAAPQGEVLDVAQLRLRVSALENHSAGLQRMLTAAIEERDAHRKVGVDTLQRFHDLQRRVQEFARGATGEGEEDS